MSRPRCAVEPSGDRPWLEDAVRDGGGEVVPPDEAEALVWADHERARQLRALLDDHPGIRWVQLPWAGIEPFVDVLDDEREWTCGKGVYAPPVAEHALALALAGMRGVGWYAQQRDWTSPRGRNLLGANVTVLGGGGIAQEFLGLLTPFDTRTTVVRNRPEPLEGADRVVGSDDLHAALEDADLVMLALALTPETEHILDAEALSRLPDHAWVVNVARGRHIDTDALVEALRNERLGGAGLDVTDPEPLPSDHPLWELPNAIITPHVGNTPEMAIPLLSRRVAENVRRFGAGEPLIGTVDVDLGY